MSFEHETFSEKAALALWFSSRSEMIEYDKNGLFTAGWVYDLSPAGKAVLVYVCDDYVIGYYTYFNSDKREQVKDYFKARTYCQNDGKYYFLCSRLFRGRMYLDEFTKEAFVQ